MKDMGLLNTSPEMRDAGESNLAFLYGAWRLVWEYKQFNTIVGINMSEGGLIMRSRYQDLVSLLQNFRINTDELAGCDGSLTTTMMVELILMHLHVSLEDIQLLAGREGREDAIRVYPSLQEWINTAASRRAVWHAGQVLRCAKSMPPQLLRDFSAIAVYHASLTFWAYGVILNTCKSSNAADGAGSPPSSLVAGRQSVWLDQAETTLSQRFIAMNRGVPGIHGVEDSQPAAFLENPGAVIDAVMDILKRNHDARGDQQPQPTRPPLVENLVQLMHGLRNAMEVANI
jgi:hypothetical protein